MTEVDARPGGAGLLGRVLLCGALALAFTLLILQYSFRHGKLLVPLVYDDVGYFLDALTRLDAFHAGGIIALARAHVADPPHAPFATYLALGSFALLGVQEWAPYAGNVVIVWTLLAFVEHRYRDFPLRWRMVLLLFVLTIPVAGAAIFEFRPDIACGLLTAAGVVMTLDRPFITASPRHQAVAGACFGLALLVKPAIFGLTIVLAGVSLALATLSDLRAHSHGRRAIFRSYLAFALPAVIVPLPHLVLTWRYYLDYVHVALFAATKPIEAWPGNWLVQLRYYVDGPGGRQMLGGHVYLLLALLLAGAALRLLRVGTDDRLRLAARLVVLLVSLLIPALNPVKQGFFGVTFAILLALLALEELRESARDGSFGWGSGATALILLTAGACGFRWPPRQGDPGTPATTTRNRVVREIYRSVAEDGLRRDLHVVLTTVGRVNPEYLEFLARKEGRKGDKFVALGFEDGPDQVRKAFDGADFVVASEPGNSESYSLLPTGRIEGATLRLVASRPDFVQRAVIPTLGGKSYFVFERVRPFFGWRAVEGLLPEEGPYPRKGLPVVRWGCGPSSRLSVVEGVGGARKVILDGRSDLPGQVVTCQLDGVEIGRHIFAEAGRFEVWEIPLRLSPGAHLLELAYAISDPGAGPRRAVLYRKLQIMPASN
jgi:hypothetical protein